MKKKLAIIVVVLAASLVFAIPASLGAFAAIADDTYFDSKQTSLTTIDVQSAWDITTGSQSVKVGVMDSGIVDHEDFGVTGNKNLLAGYDFYNNNSVTTDDPVNHGTRVAGVIGAKGNNSKGVSGICWDVSLIPLQISSVPSNNYLEDPVAAIDAINYARNNNIPIINFSGGFYDVGQGTEYKAALSDSSQKNSLKAAVKAYPGLIICGAGNDNSDLSNKKIYPGQFKDEDSNINNIIVVGASNANGSRITGTEGSNYGNLVDIYAPGNSNDIYTTKSDGTYDFFNATSAAAPHVTGVAALIKSVNTNISTANLKAAILNNYSYGKNTDGTTNASSQKIVDAYKAVSSVAFNTTELSDGTLKITGKNFTPKASLKIPSEINGKTVSQIESSVFLGSSNLTSVTIPQTVTSIGNGVFRSCSRLTNVYIQRPASIGITTLGSSAFADCTKLNSIYVPDVASASEYRKAVNWSGYASMIGVEGRTMYGITYLDGGDRAFSGTHETGYPVVHAYGMSTTLKSASKPGYTFCGWYLDRYCSGTPVTSLVATGHTGNITLYAKWSYDQTPDLSYAVYFSDSLFIYYLVESPTSFAMVSLTGGAYVMDVMINTGNYIAVMIYDMAEVPYDLLYGFGENGQHINEMIYLVANVPYGVTISNNNAGGVFVLNINQL